MNDRPATMDDQALGAALSAAFDALDWPPTPDVTPRVADTIRTARRAGISHIPLGLPRRRRTVWLIAAAILLLSAAAVGAAKLVIDLGGVEVKRLPGVPSATTSIAPGELGTPVSLADAGRIAGFEPLVPTALGPPDRVWVDRAAPGFDESERVARIVMAWRPRDGLPRIPGSGWGAVVLEFDGEANVAAKVVFDESGTLESVTVHGREGYLVEGEHELRLLTGSGYRTYLVRGLVLVWNERPGLVLRIETALPAARALRIADGFG